MEKGTKHNQLMISTNLIHSIIEEHGHYTRNQDLMKALKALRNQVVKEASATESNARKYLKLKYQ